MTVCVQPLPHCETDVYHALLPIPKYPTERSKRKFDHQVNMNVILNTAEQML